MSETLTKVRDVVAKQLGIDADTIKPESNFQNDLGADSLDLVELVMSFEEEFKVEIPDEESEGLLTVQDAVNFIDRKQAA